MTDPDLADGDYGDAPPPAGHNNPPTFEEELRQEHAAVFLRLDALKLERGKLPAVVNDDAGLAAVGVWIKEAVEVTKAAKKAQETAKAPLKVKTDTIDRLFLTKGVCGEVDKLVAVVRAIADDYTARKAAERRRQLEAEAEARRREEEARAYEAAALKDAGANSAAEVVESQAEHAGKAAERLAAKAQGGVADVVRTRLDGVTASGREVWVGEFDDLSQIDFNALRDAGVIYGHEAKAIVDRYVAGGGRELAGVKIYSKTVSTFR